MTTITCSKLGLSLSVTDGFVVYGIKREVPTTRTLELDVKGWAKAMTAMQRELRDIVHRQNLYSGCSRFINPIVTSGVLRVENLQTGEFIPYANDGSFRDGRGSVVLL